METRLEHIIDNENHQQNKGLNSIITTISNTISEIKKINISGQEEAVRAEALLFRLTNLGELFHDLQNFIQHNSITVSPAYGAFIQEAIRLRDAFVHHYNKDYDPARVVAACVGFTQLANQAELKKILTDQTFYNFAGLSGLFQMVNQQFPQQPPEPHQSLVILRFLIQKLNQLINHQNIDVITNNLSSPLATAIQNCVATIVVLTYSQEHRWILTYLQPLIDSLLIQLDLLSTERGKVIHQKLDFSQNQLKFAIELIRKLEPIVNASQLCIQNGWMSSAHHCDQVTQLILHKFESDKIQQERENERLTQANQTLLTQLTTLTQSNGTLQAQVTALTQNNGALQTQVATITQNNRGVQEQVTTLIQTNQALNATVIKQKDELDQKAETIQNLSGQIQQVKKDLENTQKESEKLNKQLENNKLQIENQKKRMENLQAELKLRDEKSNNMQEQLKDKDNEMNALRQELKKSKEEKKKLEKIAEENNKQKTEIKKLEEKIEQQDANREKREQENEGVKKAFQREKEESKKTENNNNQTIKQQAEEIKRLKQENAVASKRLMTGASASAIGGLVGGLVGNFLMPGIGGIISGAMTGTLMAVSAASYVTQQLAKTTTTTISSAQGRGGLENEDIPVSPQLQLNSHNRQQSSSRQLHEIGEEKIFSNPLSNTANSSSSSSMQKETEEETEKEKEKSTFDKKLSNQ